MAPGEAGQQFAYSIKEHSTNFFLFKKKVWCIPFTMHIGFFRSVHWSSSTSLPDLTILMHCNGRKSFPVHACKERDLADLSAQKINLFIGRPFDVEVVAVDPGGNQPRPPVR